MPQSCFEASVNALPWINVMCGISQVAAAPLQWRRQEARKQPKGLHSYTGDMGGGFFISLILSHFLLLSQSARSHICKVTKNKYKFT